MEIEGNADQALKRNLDVHPIGTHPVEIEGNADQALKRTRKRAATRTDHPVEIEGNADQALKRCLGRRVHEDDLQVEIEGNADQALKLDSAVFLGNSFEEWKLKVMPIRH